MVGMALGVTFKRQEHDAGDSKGRNGGNLQTRARCGTDTIVTESRFGSTRLLVYSTGTAQGRPKDVVALGHGVTLKIINAYTLARRKGDARNSYGDGMQGSHSEGVELPLSALNFR